MEAFPTNPLPIVTHVLSQTQSTFFAAAQRKMFVETLDGAQVSLCAYCKPAKPPAMVGAALLIWGGKIINRRSEDRQKAIVYFSWLYFAVDGLIFKV